MLKQRKEKKVKYYLEADGAFVIENYNFAKPFANFFPGIAGKYGIPMWVFYVNRGQGIVSLGTKDKDHAIVEFFPANKAWQLVSLQGFRTFIKLTRGRKNLFYEPFHNGFINLGFNLANKMSLTSYDLRIEENNLSLGIKVNVEYFTIPNDYYASLARILTIKNTAKTAKTIQLVDGLPQIVPYGISNLFLKKLGRTIEAWMKVKNLEKGVPFYKIDVDPTDRPQVIPVNEGNFYLGFHYEKDRPKIIKPIVDPQHIFGAVADFSCPRKFLAQGKFSYPKEQITQNKTPSGFSFLNLRLRPGEEKTLYTLVGYMKNQGALNAAVKKIILPGYLAQKKEENKKIIRDLQSDINTVSGCKEFDLYAQQTYLDNIIRGGYPLVFSRPSPKLSETATPKEEKSDSRQAVFYVYSRKHGDLERDYNKFQIQPAYFSQGNGNYRDVNQNRRCDIWFNPQIQDENLIALFNLIQADGFNPLVVKGSNFTLKEAANFKKRLKGAIKEEDLLKITAHLDKPFTPGDIILFLEENKIKLNISSDEFLDILVTYSIKNQGAEHGEGFWTDHWTYNLDLLVNYLNIYPEKLKEIVFDKRVFTFYDNTETVKPREQKYILLEGSARQLHSLMPDNAKREMIKKRAAQPHLVRTQYGKGEIYQTTLVNKLLCLLANKLASLDPFGVGIEMEADKPNWFDALNGLPALFGSSLNETFELKRLILFIKMALDKNAMQKISVTEETYHFLSQLAKLIKSYFNNNLPDKDYYYWDKSYSLKEDYRQKTRLGFSGNELEIGTAELDLILNNALKKIELGISSGWDAKRNIYCAYFINEVIAYEPLKAPFIRPTKFSQKKLPLFLEGQMHALRLSENIARAKALYEATKNSELYDRKLKMYKVTASLKNMPPDIGRCRVFTPGWLENESVWLHMEYKYLLEVLCCGLYREFYQDFKNVLVPFQNPARYGRNILENSSFIVSSVFPDKNLHGNGFVARLSGSTAEFLNLWLFMNIGKEPFIINSKKELQLKFAPILPGWLFTKKDNTYSFNFLSKVRVVYHNRKMKDTFGKKAVKPKRIIFNDKDAKRREILSDTVPAPYAGQIRARQIKQIDIYLE